ncbi:MAG: hypothetical protein M1833_006273 [Piccolia ochrophora]|nr:MAG: hypothetical protein M1833_006273 [Piccolia ochrophora]
MSWILGVLLLAQSVSANTDQPPYINVPKRFPPPRGRELGNVHRSWIESAPNLIQVFEPGEVNTTSDEALFSYGFIRPTKAISLLYLTTSTWDGTFTLLFYSHQHCDLASFTGYVGRPHDQSMAKLEDSQGTLNLLRSFRIVDLYSKRERPATAAWSASPGATKAEDTIIHYELYSTANKEDPFSLWAFVDERVNDCISLRFATVRLQMFTYPLHTNYNGAFEKHALADLFMQSNPWLQTLSVTGYAESNRQGSPVSFLVSKVLQSRTFPSPILSVRATRKEPSSRNLGILPDHDAEMEDPSLDGYSSSDEDSPPTLFNL